MLDPIRDEIKRIYGYPTEILPLLDDLEFAFHPNRNQYHSTPVLEQLALKAPADAIKVLALVQVDLFIPILTHVYGEAQLGGTACIISIARLITGPDMGGVDSGAGRIVKEATHELGHCFDLRHCEDEHCIMHYCRKLEDVDKKSNQFCRYCRIFLSDNIKSLGG